jgi:ATP-binding protein involved in chromosome partitioning
VRLFKNIEFLIITTPSLLAFEVVKKQVALLCELHMPIVGVIENMKADNSTAIKQETTQMGLKYLGSIDYDTKVESSIGNPAKLLETTIGEAMEQIKKAAVIEKGNCR